MKIRFAVSAGPESPDPVRLKDMVQTAERLGFDTLWFSDLTVLPATDPLLAVATAAAVSERIKLGVNLVPFGYQPFVLARQVAQLDRLSAGRLLVTLVPGLDQPNEREALGIGSSHRGRLLDSLIPVLRRLWNGSYTTAGEGRTGEESNGEEANEEDSSLDPSTGLPALPCPPLQKPLEIWLGGSGPLAIARAGRLADGWLGSLMTPDQASDALARIQNEASRAGRSIDPEHFGLSIAYARAAGDLQAAPKIRRRPEVNLAAVVPVGREALRDLIGQLVAAGLSKFVVHRLAPVESWNEELEWLAGTILDLQT